MTLLTTEALAEAGGAAGWCTTLVLDDGASYTSQIDWGLKQRPSERGEGKWFDPVIAFLGLESSLAWQAACGDPYYPVMKQGAVTFKHRLAAVSPLASHPVSHYLSLGPGDATKDVAVIRAFAGRGGLRTYAMADVNNHLMQAAYKEVREGLDVPPARIVAFQVNFAQPDQVAELADGLHRFVGPEPVVVSLLGNTIANHHDDAGFLSVVAAVLRPCDLLLLEVATTDVVDDERARLAAAEYAGSERFRRFVTRPLKQFTTLPFAVDDVAFDGSVEGARALRVKAVYRNTSSAAVRFEVPGGAHEEFPPGDTIVLHLTRKYHRDALPGLVASASLQVAASAHTVLPTPLSKDRFGMELMVLRRSNRPDKESRAEALWRKDGEA